MKEALYREQHSSTYSFHLENLSDDLHHNMLAAGRQVLDISSRIFFLPMRAVSGAQKQLRKILTEELDGIKEAGTWKTERVITSPQNVVISVEAKSDKILNFCANNYLGLSSHPDVVSSAKNAAEKYGAGLSSVRFICGTQNIHKELERKLREFHGKEDAILFPSCFDANAALFEALLSDKDAVFSDELNHASIIDGIRLCKARKFRYNHRNMEDLEEKLKSSGDARIKLIATDGVFSMDGNVAPLPEICNLAKIYNAITFVDDCHASGFLGKTGRGTEDFFGLHGAVDIINSTLGKALGGASGGYTVGPQELIQLLRQRGRPYLFSNSLPPPVVAAGMKKVDGKNRLTCSKRVGMELSDPEVDESPQRSLLHTDSYSVSKRNVHNNGSQVALDIVMSDNTLQSRIERNTQLFRQKMKKAGFTIAGDDHPICPVMLGDAKLASVFADKMLGKGIFVIGFSYPVVPKNKARIRVQISAAHSQEDIDLAVGAFISIGKELQLIP